MNSMNRDVAATVYRSCPATQVFRLIRTRKNGVPDEMNGISVNSRISSSETSRIEPLSPKDQINASPICMVVPCSAAKRTALSVSRKHRTNARPKVMTILGFLRHCLCRMAVSGPVVPRRCRRPYFSSIQISRSAIISQTLSFSPHIRRSGSGSP